MRYDATLNVNGRAYPVEIEPGRNLLSVLRGEVGLTGAKEGCDDSECGACMVLLDGQPVNSCSYLALQADGREIVTIEGLAGPDGELHALQQAFLDQGGVQCGFCTPGMLISAKALLDRNPSPDGGRDPPGAVRQPLPLHRLLGHRARRAGGVRAARGTNHLSSQAARSHRPDRLDPAVAHREQLVAEVDRGADVGGMKRDPLAHRHRP